MFRGLVIIIMGLESVSASEDVIEDLIKCICRFIVGSLNV